MVKKLETILEETINQSDLNSQDIPTLDLYMDQIMTLFENNLTDNKRHQDDKLLTKTMINNYSKAGIIKPVKGKKYSKEQIIAMLLIYNLKNTITLQEIKQLLTPVYENNQDLETIYNYFLKIKNEQKSNFKTMLENIVSNYELDIKDDQKRLILILVLAYYSNQFSVMAAKIIDSCFEEDS